MASVRTDGPLPPSILAWSVEGIQPNNVDPTKETRTNSLAFQPLVTCLRFLGVELDPSTLDESSTKCHRCRVLLVGLFFLLLNGFCNIYRAVLGRNRDTIDYSKASLSTLNQSSMLTNGNHSVKVNLSSVMSWNLIVDYANYGVLAVGVHISLFILSRQEKWKFFWDNVQQILQHHDEFKHLKKTIRRLTIAGLLIGLFESLFLMSLPVYFFKFKETRQIVEALFRSLAHFLRVYAFASLLLFAIIGWTVALGFRSLGRELVNSSLFTTSSSQGMAEQEKLVEMMTKWKRLHILLCDTVDGINDCFGPILLIWVAHIFVDLIATPFYIVGGFRSSTATSSVIMGINIFLMMTQAFHLFVITGVSSRIWHEAIENGKLLQQVHLKDSSYHLQEQVNMLATEVLLSIPRITAMEYGDLDLSLIPTLVGTTLTYLIILCQFQSSEE